MKYIIIFYIFLPLRAVSLCSVRALWFMLGNFFSFFFYFFIGYIILLFTHNHTSFRCPLHTPTLQVGRSAARRRSGIPRSTGTSREPSPQRYGATPLRSSVAAPSPRPAQTAARPPIKPLLTEKILRQSQEAESALADALVSAPPIYSLTHWLPHCSAALS